MKILIVDDSADVRLLIRAILEHDGHTVVGEAEDGASALKAFAKLRPDVILLDIIMPGKSGLEVLQEIRETDTEVKVVMVTAVEQDGINRRLMLLGADGIIYKPFSSLDFEKAFHGFKPRKQESGAGDDTITRLAAGGLSKCMLRTTEVSSWTWELCDVSVFPGKASDVAGQLNFGKGAASVQVNIRNGASFVAAMVFRAEDSALISSCFVQGPLYDTGNVKDMEESLLLEIGNIILNALANPLINALKKIAIPSVPMLIKGGPGAVAASLNACLDPGQDLRIISAALAMRHEGRTARAVVLGILPEVMAAELELVGGES